METVKKLMKIKKTLAELELFFPEKIQEILTREIKEQVEETESNLLAQVRNLKSLDNLEDIKKDLKKLHKAVRQAEEIDKQYQDQD